MSRRKPSHLAAAGEPKGRAMSSVWSTPQRIYDKLHREFGFNLDVCADRENAKATFFLSGDGLHEDWGNARCWMNPPYGREIADWIKKAYESAQKGALVVALLPGRTNAPWWHDYVMKAAEIRFVRKKLAYDLNGHRGKGVPAFGSVIAVFRPGAHRTKWSSWEQPRA